MISQQNKLSDSGCSKRVNTIFSHPFESKTQTIQWRLCRLVSQLNISVPVFHDMGLLLCNKLIIAYYIFNKSYIISHSWVKRCVLIDVHESYSRKFDDHLEQNKNTRLINTDTQIF